MSRRHTLMLVVLAAIWGSSFMFIKVAVRALDPVTVVWLRLTLGALVLVPLAFAGQGRDAIPQFRAAAWRLTLLGIFNSALPFTLLAWAELRLDSGVAAILQGAAPLFTALISLRFGLDRIGGMRFAGILVGFAGVALLVGAHGGNDLLAALAVLGMAFCYAGSSVFAAHRLGDTNSIVVAAGSMGIAALVTLPFGLATVPGHMISAKELGSVAALGLLCTGVAYVLYFAILQGAGAARSMLVTYLVPAAAVAYGAVILGEPLRVTAIVGLVVILGGVALGSGVVRPRRGTAAADSAAA